MAAGRLLGFEVACRRAAGGCSRTIRHGRGTGRNANAPVVKFQMRQVHLFRFVLVKVGVRIRALRGGQAQAGHGRRWRYDFDLNLGGQRQRGEFAAEVVVAKADRTGPGPASGQRATRRQLPAAGPFPAARTFHAPRPHTRRRHRQDGGGRSHLEGRFLPAAFVGAPNRLGGPGHGPV